MDAYTLLSALSQIEKHRSFLVNYKGIHVELMWII